MRRRARPLDFGERRALQDATVQLELEILLDESEYVDRWPESPLAKILATAKQRKPEGSSSASKRGGDGHHLSAAAAAAANSTSNPTITRPPVRVPPNETSSAAAAGAELKQLLDALGEQYGSAMLASPTDLDAQEPLFEQPEFTLPTAWVAHLVQFHAPWSRRLERLYEDLVIAVEREMADKPFKEVLPAALASTATAMTISGIKARRDALKQYAVTVWNRLGAGVAAAASAAGGDSSNNNADASNGGGSNLMAMTMHAASECNQQELAALWATARMSSARLGHELGLPLVSAFWRYVEDVDEYFIPVQFEEDDGHDDDTVVMVDDDDSSSSSSSEVAVAQNAAAAPRRGRPPLHKAVVPPPPPKKQPAAGRPRIDKKSAPSAVRQPRFDMTAAATNFVWFAPRETVRAVLQDIQSEHHRQRRLTQQQQQPQQHQQCVLGERTDALLGQGVPKSQNLLLETVSWEAQICAPGKSGGGGDTNWELEAFESELAQVDRLVASMSSL